MEKDSDPSGGWRFAQCFGDKGEVEDITEGECFRRNDNIEQSSRHHSTCWLQPEIKTGGQKFRRESSVQTEDLVGW